jgi:hypothetical protein
MVCLCQYKVNNQKVTVKRLDSGDEAMTGEYTDVLISQIDEIIINGITHYLTIGWGTHGGGQHHKIAQIFKIENEQLIKCSSCFETGNDLVIVAPRSQKITLAYDKATKALTYSEVIYDDEKDYLRPPGKTITLKLQDGVFK